MHSVRQAVAVVSDDPFLFSASVAENIAYARPGASREEIEQAARRAQAHDFITRLPQGYETQVGERGLTVSGGQRQRLAIARALLSDPRVLVLDDATSSVDASTEQSIKLALAEAMAGRTTFVIAHRLSTIALADEIVVLDHGRLVARGEHAKLLQSSPVYREIVAADSRPATGGRLRARQPRRARRQPGGRRAMSTRGTGTAPPQRRTQGRVRPRSASRQPVDRGARLPRQPRAQPEGACWPCWRPTACASPRWCSRWCSGPRASLVPPLLARLAIDNGITHHDPEVLWLSVLAFLVSAVLVWAATHAQTYLVGWVGQRALADLRIRIFTHLQRQPIGFYESRPAGVLISRITNDVEALESLVTDSVVTLFQAGLTLIGAIGVLVVPRPEARAVDVLRRAVRGRRQHLVPARVGGRLPAHAGDDRRDHGLPAGDAVGHPRRPQLRPGAQPTRPASPSSTRRTARRTWSPSASTPPTSRPWK